MTDNYQQTGPPISGGTSGGGMSNPMTSLGDMIFGVDALGNPGRLPIGSAGQVLTVVGGIPAWTPVALSSLAAGSTAQGPIVWTGTAWSNALLQLAGLAPGGTVGAPIVWTAGGWSNQLLTLAGIGQSAATSGQVPTWSGSAWVPQTPTIGPVAGSVANAPLVWNGTAWVNVQLPLAGIAGGSATSGQVPTWNGSAWVPQTPATGGMSNPMTTVGDIITGGASGAAGRLGVGSAGQVLTVVSGAPAWAAATGGMSNPMTARGQMISGGVGGVPQALPTGATGMTLVAQGASADPVWLQTGWGLNPMTTAGDIITGGASGAPGRLGIGSAGQVLTVVSGAPAWAAASGGGGGAVVQLGTALLNGSNSVTLASSIPATYNHLMILFSAKSSNAAQTVQCGLRFNGDTAANYYAHRSEFSSTATTADTRTEILANARLSIGLVPGANATDTAIPAVGQVLIPNYASTVNKKIVRASVARASTTTTGNLLEEATMGFWNNAAAITQVDITLFAGNFAADSYATLYAYT